MRILANDGIDEAGRKKLEEAGFIVDTGFLDADQLLGNIDEYDVLIVRSATNVRKDLINRASNLKIIGRGGVGLDNIDVQYAESKGIKVINTPAASSTSVAELVFAHLYGVCRFLPMLNRKLVQNPEASFKDLKKAASKGIELKGKTLGIIGIGRIGKETARIAIGSGMNVIAFDPFVTEASVEVAFHPDLGLAALTVPIPVISKEEVLKRSDFITLHVPGGSEAVIGEKEIALMKDGAGIVNCARGGVVNEAALNKAIKSGKIRYAGVDVFEKEPPSNKELFEHEFISVTPHIGAATLEAQERIGHELADKIIKALLS